MRETGCFAGSLYPNSRAGASGDCLQASAAGGFGLPTSAEWTHSVSYWQSIPLSASRPSPRAALPLGAEAGDPKDRNSRRIWLRPYGSGVLLAIFALIRPCCSLRPPVARASRPPPAGSDTRRCSCLRAGRLTLLRWMFCWQPLPSDSSESRARRRPHAEGCRWALQPISLLGTTSAGVKRW